VTGKGQGYLGDTNVTWEPLSVPDTLEQANELLVQGVGANGRVTRVSIFRWGGMTQGYGVSYFQGSYSATIEAGRTVGDVVKQVVTLDALDDRSDLCERTVWTRQGESAVFAASQPSIVFCLGSPPEQPTYPEAVVVAYLLTENSELVLPGSRELVKTAVPVKVNRVVRVAYPGAATVTGTGASAISQMTVETIVDDGLGESRILWSLQELRPTPEEKTTRWRIESAQKG
jgi:hypothetical protein